MGADGEDESDNNTYKLVPLENTATIVSNNDVQQNRKPRTFKEQFKDYSENTTIHGIKYLGEEKRSIFEKIWWIIGFVICVACLVWFMYTIWDKWQKSPVILALDDTPTPVYKIPFPAVTICSEVKMRTINNPDFSYSGMIGRIDPNPYSTNKPNWTELEISNFETLAHACDYKKVLKFGREIWGWDRNNTFANYELYEKFRDITLDYKDLLVECKFQRYRSCKSIYYQIFTDMGLCYTFNFVGDLLRGHDENMTSDMNYENKENFDFETGYTGPKSKIEFPFRVYTIGKLNGLNTILFTDKRDKNYNCRFDQGYRVTLHSPSEFPQPSKSFIQIGHGESVDIKIKPVKISTSENLRRYDPHRRQCYFQNERNLRYFASYNEMNCRLECISNKTSEECGCVQFGIPRGPEIPICGANSITCYGNIMANSENSVLRNKYNIEYNITSSSKGTTMADCDCLPECNSIRYEAIVVRSQYDMLQDSKDNNIYTDFNTTVYEASNINIFYEEIEYLGNTRTELYGFSDLVSNFGGLLGLFLGGSILSLVELLYFCTIRSIFNCIEFQRCGRKQNVESGA